MAFGEAAEILRRFTKGERITVLGRLQSSSYTDREGAKRTSVEVVVLRSDDAPLPRKADADPAPAPLLADAAEAPLTLAPAELGEAPAAKRRRRTKVAA